MSLFWARLNGFVAQLTAPAIHYPPPRPVAPASLVARPMRWNGGLLRMTLAEGPGAGFVPTRPRPWWDQTGIPDAMPAEQPEHLDLSDLTLLTRKDW